MEVPVQLVPVKAYRLMLLCPECGGQVKWDGYTLASNPPQYRHRCQDRECGFAFNSRKRTGEIQYLDAEQQARAQIALKQPTLSAVSEEAKEKEDGD